MTRFLGIALVAILAAAALIVPTSAAETPASIGYVDVQAVFNGYAKTQTSNKDLEALSKQLVDKLKAISDNKLLSEAERNELTTLLAKPAATDKDKERVKALQDQEIALDKELKDLQAKKEPTEQEKARLKELQDRSAASDAAIAKLGQDSEKQFEAKKAEMSELIRGDILKAIDAIAKQKNIGVVVDKMAVLYGGVDITTPVLDQLNKKK